MGTVDLRRACEGTWDLTGDSRGTLAVAGEVCFARREFELPFELRAQPKSVADLAATFEKLQALECLSTRGQSS
jgi:hypothetical protein